MIDRISASVQTMDSHSLPAQGGGPSLDTQQLVLSGSPQPVSLQASSLSSEGAKCVFSYEQSQLLIVADGIGRDAPGRRASWLTIAALTAYVREKIDAQPDLEHLSDDEIRSQLAAAIRDCQAQLRAQATTDPQLVGMGTTLTCAYIVWPRMFLAHAGDSRCYLHRNFRLERLTVDHTVAEKMVENGVLRREQVAQSRWKNVLWNSVGASKIDSRPDLRVFRLLVGDSLLLCSDALTKRLPDRRIAEVMRENVSAEETCRRLTESADAVGGADKITLVLARFRHAFARGEAHEGRPRVQSRAEDENSHVANRAPWRPESRRPADTRREHR